LADYHTVQAGLGTWAKAGRIPTTWTTGVTHSTAPSFSPRFSVSPCRLTVAELVSVYQHHLPAISILPGAEALIQDLRLRGIPLGLISDGPVVGQSAKLTALGANQLFEVVILTDKWGAEYRKPHDRAFITMEQRMSGARPLVYLADNPAKDFITANRRGWRTIRIRLDGQLHRDVEPAEPAAAPEFDLSGFDEVLSVLEGIGSEPLH
jgi:putative hydrolase of the HAD superfamily